jgi:hypothetical protein
MEKREQISVPLDPALRREIERVAAAEERSVAGQIRRWIADGLRATEQRSEAA